MLDGWRFALLQAFPTANASKLFPGTITVTCIPPASGLPFDPKLISVRGPLALRGCSATAKTGVLL